MLLESKHSARTTDAKRRLPHHFHCNTSVFTLRLFPRVFLYVKYRLRISTEFNCFKTSSFLVATSCSKFNSARKNMICDLFILIWILCFLLFYIYFPGVCIGLKFITSQSELFWFIPISVSEPMRIILNQSDLIRLIPRNQPEWIRTNKKSSFQSRSIWINPISDWSKPHFQSKSIRMNPRSE